MCFHHTATLGDHSAVKHVVVGVFFSSYSCRGRQHGYNLQFIFPEDSERKVLSIFVHCIIAILILSNVYATGCSLPKLQTSNYWYQI